ncbi:lipoate-protein ligase-like protein B [Viridothelium virens]|uniref:Octanoyltransferase n=1 Tax=Viridothelium virens TaxID=1048519 RepID=A0A6A6HC08_VIRVR|nr:lipoate-protein ligase-like protein B [Viridothelium virens]
MRLSHFAIPGVSKYQDVASIQDRLVSRLLAYKAHPRPPQSEPPRPTIMTAQFHPVYTYGRRDIGSVSEEQLKYLRDGGRADFVEALRGGQTTFHGPGQLVAYPIIDLKRHGISPRDYVCLLERSVIATCARYGIKGMTTENPGVWTTPEKKIAALGIHLRRHVTSHGIGLNVCTDLWWFERIVACGLEGKKTTSLEAEGVRGGIVEEVGRAFVEEMASRLEIEKIVPAVEKDLEI